MNRRTFVSGALAVGITGEAAQAVSPSSSAIGLILVGASWCPFCKSASRTLYAGTRTVGVPVLVASNDGKKIPPFEDFVDAREHPLAAKIQSLPTLLFVHIPSQQVIAQIEGFRNPRQYLTDIRNLLVKAQEAGYA